MYWLIYASLMALALGLVTSISILALSHILILIPGIYFLTKINFKKISLSSWALITMIIVIVASVLFNQDISATGYKAIFKAKYFLFGFLMIAPFNYFFKHSYDAKKVSYLVYAFCIATSIASIMGMIAMKTEFNYLTWRDVSPWRNSGLFGMGMNYAHNVTYFLIIIAGLIFYRRKTLNFVNTNFLYVVFCINFIGLYLSYTRGALLALLIGIPFYFYKRHKNRFWAVFLCLIFTGGLIYFVAGSKLIRPTSDSERLSLWIAATKAYEERPILGYGYLNFEHHSLEIKKRYNLPESHYSGHAHNNFFEMLASTGTLGILAFCFWLFSWFYEMYKRNDIVANITLPFIVVFFVSGLTQATITLGINLFFIMSVYALSQSLDCFHSRTSAQC